MTIQMDWPPEAIDQLTAQARRKGLSLDVYVLQTLLAQDNPDCALNDEASTRRRRAEACAEIRELQPRVKPDPEGWTSRDYINYGRR